MEQIEGAILSVQYAVHMSLPIPARGHHLESGGLYILNMASIGHRFMPYSGSDCYWNSMTFTRCPEEDFGC